MKAIKMNAEIKIPRVKTPKSRSRLLRSWKFNKSTNKQYAVNQVEPEWMSPAAFTDLQEYMNEWLNHPLYPELFGN